MMLVNDALRDMHKNVVKRFVDVIILGELKKSAPLSAYDVVSFINQKFRVMISPGKIYPILYALERNGLIKGDFGARKRIYTLTDQGARTLKEVAEEGECFLYYLMSLF